MLAAMPPLALFAVAGEPFEPKAPAMPAQAPGPALPAQAPIVDGKDGGGGHHPQQPPPPLPVRRLPPAPASGPGAPECHGLLNIGGTPLLLVRMPGDGTLQPAAVGAQIAEIADPSRRWTLLGIAAGALARWRDPDGFE
jgi:hypothetical protein